MLKTYSPYDKPFVGLRGGYSVGSDIYACTVVRVSPSGQTVWVRNDKVRGDKEGGHDFYGDQKWICETDMNGELSKFTWRKKANRYRHIGWDHGTLILGRSCHRVDPGF